VLQCVAVCCSRLQDMTQKSVCCSVLQCVVVCRSVLSCVAVCCSVLQCVTRHEFGLTRNYSFQEIFVIQSNLETFAI